jgi:hypothetical protein
MHIGIYASYDMSEIGLSALRLADLAAGLGLDVKYLVTGNHVLNLDETWDQRVRSAGKASFASWGRDATCCVWFEPHRARLELVRAVNSKARQVLVLPWQSVPDRQDWWLKAYDLVLCPSERSWIALSHALDRPSEAQVLHWTSGFSGEAISRRRDDAVDVYAPLGCATKRYHGTDVLRCVDTLLDNIPELHFVVSSPSSWNREERCTVKQMQEHHNSRFISLVRPPMQAHVQQMARSHWVWLPEVRPHNGLSAAQATASGAPVMAWNVSPNDEVTYADRNSHLIHCEFESNWLYAPTVIWDSLMVMQACTAAFTDRKAWEGHHEEAKALTPDERSFTNFWKAVWGY